MTSSKRIFKSLFGFKSISKKLMLSSILVTFLVPLGFWTILYFSLKHSLMTQDQEVLADRIHALEILLQTDSPPWEHLKSRVEKEWFGRNFERIFVRVLDQNRNVLTQTPNIAEEHKDVLESLNEMRQTKYPARFESGSLIYQTALEVATGGSGAKYYIEIAMERTNEQNLLANFRNFFWFLILVGGAASLWTSGALVRIALQPIRQVTELAATVNSDRLDARIEIEALPIELRELGLTLNNMLDRLHDSFFRLAKFSEDMAHELRTPVNNLLGSMTVALARERSLSDYRNLIGSSIEDCERLKRIIDSLLFIARTSDPDQKIPKQELQLDEEMKDIASFYQVSAEEKNISIELNVQGPIRLLAERTLLQRCVGNLLSNSIRHSPDNSKILLSVGQTGNEVVIQVKDFGCGIPRESLSQVGERFFKVDPSRSHANGGTGLGLSIVKSIVNVHAGTMHVDSELTKWTTVTLRFPAEAPQPTREGSRARPLSSADV